MNDSEEEGFPQHRVEFDDGEVVAVMERVRQILVSGRLTLGPYTEEFEARFAARVGSKWAVAVNSGTSALEIILRALQVAGAEVLVPSNTNFATGIAVLNAGGRCYFSDLASPTRTSAALWEASHHDQEVTPGHTMPSCWL